jgi:hypothetical protein
VNAEARYSEIADDLAARNADVELGQMMGMPAIKAGGKMIGGFAQTAGAMVFKLPDPAIRERALALEGAALFDPAGGRPMKEWVQVPPAHAGEWAALAEHALALRRS